VFSPFKNPTLDHAARDAVDTTSSPSAQEAVAWLDRFLPPLREMRAIILRLDALELPLRERMFATDVFLALTESLRWLPVYDLDAALKKLREIEAQMKAVVGTR
jgi:hypothetical protein